ncbi:MAG: aminopeptidase N, partial [Pseudomonadota bacterium]
YITGSGRSIDLKIYSEPHNIGQCDYAMDVLKRSMAWDEEAFGREYDLDIYMIVAVEDFNMGAMENKGLNVFNTSCVLASPDTATDAAYLRVEAVVAHEYFHNWSGNRVTCRDWFQLSLKEGFTVFRDAEFSGDMNSRAVKRIEDVGFLRSVQFAEDAGPLAHSVRPDSYIEISNFYTTTIYEKGAEVVRMYHTLLGPELFRAGSDLYFDRFDGQAVTTDDFCAVMQEVSGIDLQQFKRWYEQAGTPELTVTETFVDGSLRLQIDQRCPDTPGQSNKPPLHIPLRLGLLDENGAELKCDGGVVTSDAEIAVRTDGLLVQLKAARTVIEVAGLVAKPVVSFLRCFSAPVRVAYARPAQELAFLAVQDTDGFVRWDALQTLWIEHFDGHGSVDLVALVGELAAQAATLNSAEAMQLAAQMLVVPEANYVFEQLAEFDVDGVLDARDAALSAIASAHRAHWQQLYDKTVSTSAFQPDGLSMARRALNNIALAYLVRAEPADAAATLIRAHFDGADNLTARRGALQAALSRADEFGQLTEDLLSGFYARWKDEALVIDLWFNLQAQADSTSVERACALAEHEAFNAQNPNRARSLYAAFAMFNHRRFHALDGSGYDFLGAAIAELDNINPQLAARLATPLTRWQRYDARRQGLMRGVLQALAGKADISKDLYEIATKSLAV